MSLALEGVPPSIIEMADKKEEVLKKEELNQMAKALF
jgi:hypothetical protein